MDCMASTSGNDIVLLDVDVLDGGSEKLFFRRHSNSRIAKRGAAVVNFRCCRHSKRG